MPEESKQTETSPEKVEQKADLNDRAKLFIQEYGELVKKHNMDFATYPMFVPDGSGGFKIVCQNTPVDMTNQPAKSPFIS